MAGTVVIDSIQSSVSTPPVFRNTSGTEIGQLCRSWVNFNSTGGIVVIRSSFNTSSVTRTAAGTFTVNLTTGLADANMAITCGGKQDSTYSDRMAQSYNISSSSYGLVFAAWNIGAIDATWIFASVFR